jgi:hypothetical protein
VYATNHTRDSPANRAARWRSGDERCLRLCPFRSSNVFLHHRCDCAPGKRAHYYRPQGYALCLLELPDITQQNPSQTSLQIEVDVASSSLRKANCYYYHVLTRKRTPPRNKQTPLALPSPSLPPFPLSGPFASSTQEPSHSLPSCAWPQHACILMHLARLNEP